MMKSLFTLTCAFVASFAVAATAATPTSELPVEAFASLPQVQTARISPNGQYLATRINVDGISHVTTMRIGEAQAPRSILSTDNKQYRINWVQWVNDDRLLVSVRYPARILTSTGLTETELFTVSRDGSDFKALLDTTRARWVPQIRDRVIDFLPEDPEHVLMELDMEKPNLRDVYEVDVETGKRHRVQRGRIDVDTWFTDRQHRIRGFVRLDDSEVSVEVGDVDGKGFRTLWRFDYLSPGRVLPMGFDHDPNILYVRAYHNGKLAVFRVDLRDKDLHQELVYADEKYDVEGQLLYSSLRKKVFGLVDTRGEDAYVVWDEEFGALLEGLRAALPDTRNTLFDIDRDENRYVLLASSPTDPGTFYFGERSKGQIAPFGKRYPQLEKATLSGKKKVTYPTTDGITVEGYLTLPQARKGNEKLPAIVFPHGGPSARTNTGFDYWSEFLSSRGYAVLEMDFRGSSGQGFDWMASAYGNWDRITQQDIADGAKYLINEGIADPKRICILGASFGGYAAMIGAAKYGGDVYRCAVSFAGVADLIELRNRSRKFVNSAMTEKQIGTDTERLREASPQYQASAIKIPLLLIHGATDRVVDVSQSQEMFEAMQSLGKDVQYVELESGDHYLSNHFERIKTFRTIESFLADNL